MASRPSKIGWISTACLLLVMNHANSARSQPRPQKSPSVLTEATSFIDARLSERPSSGLSIAIVQNGKIEAAAFGEREPGQPATPNTVYRLASVTKMFTATAILQLRDAGKLELDDEIQKHLPRYPRQKWPMTIRQLLGHLSGIANYKNRDGPEGNIQKTLSTKQSLAIFDKWPLVAKPGEKYTYTSYGYNVLGAIVEKLSGLSYGDYLERHITGPAEMKHTVLDDPAVPCTERARGYKPRGKELVASKSVNVMSRFAGGGTRGTVIDMARFGKSLLGGELVPPSTLFEMQRSMVDGEGLITDYGMGMSVYPLNGRPVAAHAGQQPETSTLLLLYPADDLVIALATNVEEQGSLLFEIAGYLAETILQGGVRRRTVSAPLLKDHLRVQVMSETMNRGLDSFLRRHRYKRDSARHLISSFHTVRTLLAGNDLDGDQELGRFWGASGGYAFNQVGAHMASILSRANGDAESLRRYHVEGALPFFRDYIKACQKLDCPVAFRFPVHGRMIVREALAWDRDFTRSSLFQAKISPSSTVKEAERLLGESLAEMPIRPNLAPDLLDLAEKELRSGKQHEALAWAKLAERYFPNEAKAVIAAAEVEAIDAPLSGERFRTAMSLPGGKKRLSFPRMSYRALVLRKAGFDNASLTVVRGATLVHPGSRAAFRALAAQARRMGRTAEATAAQAKARQLK